MHSISFLFLNVCLTARDNIHLAYSANLHQLLYHIRIVAEGFKLDHFSHVLIVIGTRFQ